MFLELYIYVEEDGFLVVFGREEEDEGRILGV